MSNSNLTASQHHSGNLVKEATKQDLKNQIDILNKHFHPSKNGFTVCKHCDGKIGKAKEAWLVKYNHFYSNHKNAKNPRCSAFDRESPDFKPEILSQYVPKNKKNHELQARLMLNEDTDSILKALHASKMGPLNDLEMFCLDFVVSNNLAFATLDKLNFRIMMLEKYVPKWRTKDQYDQARNHLKKMPSARDLSMDLLPRFLKYQASPFLVNALKSVTTPLNLTVDGWKSISSGETFGSTLVILDHAFPDGEVLLGHDAVSCAIQLEKRIMDVQKLSGRPVSCVVTDQASANVLAKSFLKIRFPYIIFMACYAHQINLIVGRIYKHYIYQTIDKIIKLARSSKNAVFKAILMKKCEEKKCRFVQVKGIAETRWNSAFQACKSVTKMSEPLLLASAEYKRRSKLNKRSNNHIPRANETLANIDEDFLDQCTAAVKVLEPFNRASLTLQHDQSPISAVLASYLKCYSSLERIKHLDVRGKLQNEFAFRWYHMEQPLFLVAWALSRKGLLIAINILRNEVFDLETTQKFQKMLFNGIIFYYKTHMVPEIFEKQQILKVKSEIAVANITEQIDALFYLESGSSLESTIRISKSTKKLWLKVKRLFPELASFALFMKDLINNSSSCERTFKVDKNIKTKQRARMTDEKMRMTAKARYYISKLNDQSDSFVADVSAFKTLARINTSTSKSNISDSTYISLVWDLEEPGSANIFQDRPTTTKQTSISGEMSYQQSLLNDAATSTYLDNPDAMFAAEPTTHKEREQREMLIEKEVTDGMKANFDELEDEYFEECEALAHLNKAKDQPMTFENVVRTFEEQSIGVKLENENNLEEFEEDAKIKLLKDYYGLNLNENIRKSSKRDIKTGIRKLKMDFDKFFLIYAESRKEENDAAKERVQEGKHFTCFIDIEQRPHFDLISETKLRQRQPKPKET